jgi:multiple sugar transport system permease protein
MTLAAASGRLPRYRLRRAISEAGSIVLGVLVLIWSLTPVYNMFLIALDPEEGEIEFDGNIWPPEISFEGFRAALSQEARYLRSFGISSATAFSSGCWRWC